MTGLCIALLGGQLLASVPGPSFTLAWTHSVEHIEWQEDWRVTPAGLVVEEGRVQGSGAGMDPPPDAVLAGGWWRYHPKVPPQDRVVLANSSFTADYVLCAGALCRRLDAVAGVVDRPVVLEPCR